MKFELLYSRLMPVWLVTWGVGWFFYRANIDSYFTWPILLFIERVLRFEFDLHSIALIVPSTGNTEEPNIIDKYRQQQLGRMKY